MKYFQKLLQELELVTKSYRPGETPTPPPLLNTVVIENKKLSFVQMGMNHDSIPIFCIHGFGGFFLDWGQLLLPLGRHHHVYALDLPGWGFSDPLEGKLGLESHVDILAKFIESTGHKRFALCGISYGAAVCWAFASQERLKHCQALFLLNPMPPYPIKHMQSKLYQTIFQVNRFWPVCKVSHQLLNKFQYRLTCKENVFSFERIDELYMGLGYLMIKQPKVAKSIYQFAHSAKAIDWSEWEAKIGKIKIPTLILKGLNDKVFNLESAHLLHQLIQGSQYKEFKNCGHAMIFDRPTQVAMAMRRFLNALKK